MRTRVLSAAIITGIALTSSWTIVNAAGSGTIYVNRESTFINMLGNLDIAVDGKVLGSVENGGCTKIQVPAGKHVVGSPNFFGSVRDSATVSVPSGGHVYILAQPRMEYPGPVYWTAMRQLPKGRRC
jgi:hypothetical protein